MLQFARVAYLISCTTALLRKSEQQKAYALVGWALPTSPEEEKVRSGQLYQIRSFSE